MLKRYLFLRRFESQCDFKIPSCSEPDEPKISRPCVEVKKVISKPNCFLPRVAFKCPSLHCGCKLRGQSLLCLGFMCCVPGASTLTFKHGKAFRESEVKLNWTQISRP
ncbi:hypothetical protein NPIL_237661 [Nephila pilipes]|uniref:Uncharacterized protein n=1 Tax=Nephila pilipes TaxID=299642 RepID=A0A8X6QYZ7_NEPPI|nr:hypothetical protein NPIL_237661 [Nephila pilipes]